MDEHPDFDAAWTSLETSDGGRRHAFVELDLSFAADHPVGLDPVDLAERFEAVLPNGVKLEDCCRLANVPVADQASIGSTRTVTSVPYPVDARVPIVLTERLLLREWRATDMDGHAAMSADAEVMEFLGGPKSAAEAWRHMALHAGHWQLRGFGNWVVERREDGAFLGRVGLWQPEGWPGLELGYKLARHAWGSGYATEAARAAMDWAWRELGAQQLISIIDERNAASIAVATRLGMTFDRMHDLDGHEVAIYAITAPG